MISGYKPPECLAPGICGHCKLVPHNPVRASDLETAIGCYEEGALANAFSTFCPDIQCLQIFARRNNLAVWFEIHSVDKLDASKEQVCREADAS